MTETQSWLSTAVAIIIIIYIIIIFAIIITIIIVIIKGLCIYTRWELKALYNDT